MPNHLFRLGRFLDFYRKAVTKYQLHSPFVFDLANAVLEDRRWFYAFRDVERVRRKMLESAVKLEVVDYGAAVLPPGIAPPAPPAGGRSASPPAYDPDSNAGKSTSPLASDPDTNAGKSASPPASDPDTNAGKSASPLASDPDTNAGKSASPLASANDTNAGKSASPLAPASDSNAGSTTPLPPTGGVGGGYTRGGSASVRLIARRAASTMAQGRMLFRLANWAAPQTMLELGTSLGVGAMYLASGRRSARFLTLEGCPDFAKIARANLAALDLKNTEVVTGRFEETLAKALERLQPVDLVFFDGNHRPEPTLAYFEACLPFAHAHSVFVFDDAYWSPGMEQAWQRLKEHPRVTLTVDFFDLSLAFINPDFKEKQHFRVVPARWKPWRVF